MNLSDRMKKYELPFCTPLPIRMPVIIRIDGKAFHTFTRKMEKPFDGYLIRAMMNTTEYLAEKLQGVRFAYTQSDEISLVLINYSERNSDSWFDNDIQKLCSLSAAYASVKFKQYFPDDFQVFDARCFVMPMEDVINYFIWRQKDFNRNSIQMLARSLYSHKELQNKKTPELQEMCFQKGHNWNDLPTFLKNGISVYKGTGGFFISNLQTPTFTQDREFVTRHLEVKQETGTIA